MVGAAAAASAAVIAVAADVASCPLLPVGVIALSGVDSETVS